MTLVISIAIGSAMGLLAGLIGVGGGIIAVPAMVHFLGLDIKTAMATSLAVIIPVSLSGTVKHVSAGHVDYRVAAGIAIGGVAFAYLGAYLNHKLEPDTLRKGFAVFMLCVGLKMLLEKPKAPEKAESAPPAASVPAENGTPAAPGA